MALAGKTASRPSVAGKANPVKATAAPAAARSAVAKTKSTPVAAPGEALRRANRVKGGFLDDKVAEITGARALMATFEGTDFKTNEATTVTRGNLQIEFAVEGVDDPVTRDYSLGSALPSEDGATPADEGQFICGEPGKKFRGLHESCAASIFLDKLAELGGYDEDVLVNEGFEAALKGVRGVLMEFTPERKGKPKPGAKPPRPFPVYASVDGGSGVAASDQASQDAGAEEQAGAAAEDVADAASLEDRVRELVVDLVAKGPITKTKLTSAIGKAFDGDADKIKAVSMAVKDSFLKGMAGEGLIAYDGREVGPAVEA